MKITRFFKDFDGSAKASIIVAFIGILGALISAAITQFSQNLSERKNRETATLLDKVAFSRSLVDVIYEPISSAKQHLQAQSKSWDAGPSWEGFQKALARERDKFPSNYVLLEQYYGSGKAEELDKIQNSLSEIENDQKDLNLKKGDVSKAGEHLKDLDSFLLKFAKGLTISTR